VVRGDSHYARPEAMAWCERKRIGYIFGLAGNAVLLRRAGPLAEDAALGRIDGKADKVRRYGELRYAATSWKTERRVIARVEAEPQGADSRFIVTNLQGLPRRSTKRSTVPGATKNYAKRPPSLQMLSASVESRRGAVTVYDGAVSPPRSSNQTCGFPPSGFPTGFISRHTAAGRDGHARGGAPRACRRPGAR
jgi:hypothetical protein